MKNEIGQYIYCIIFNPKKFSVEMKGIEKSPIYLVRSDRLAAVVTRAALQEFAISRRNIMHHQKVVEAVRVKYDAVLPVSFGTMAASEEVLKEKLLDAKEESLLKVLDSMKGKVEVELKAIWKDLSQVLWDISEKAPELTILDRQLEQENRLKVLNIQETILVGKIVEKDLKQKREDIKEKVLKALSDKIEDYKEAPLYADEMIFNLKLLVEKEKAKAVIKDLQEIKNRFSKEKVLIKEAGPMAPYDFALLPLEIENN